MRLPLYSTPTLSNYHLAWQRVNSNENVTERAVESTVHSNENVTEAVSGLPPFSCYCYPFQLFDQLAGHQLVSLTLPMP